MLLDDEPTGGCAILLFILRDEFLIPSASVEYAEVGEGKGGNDECELEFRFECEFRRKSEGGRGIGDRGCSADAM
jgi:hypothetical protein